MITKSMSDQRADLLAGAQAVVTTAKAAGRDLTSGEVVDVNEKVAAIGALDERIAAAKAGRSSVADQLLAPLDGGGASGSAGYLNLRGAGAKATGAKLAARLSSRGEAPGVKAIGAIAVLPELLPQSPITLGRPATSILDVLPTVSHSSPNFTWFRQTTRTNNAAVVAPGAQKPTSVYTLEPVADFLRVVAHLSQEVDSYLLQDAAFLTPFLTAELGYGLSVAVEREFLTGDGTGAHMRGILATSGIQIQAFQVDVLSTTRSAITALESLGQVAGAFLLGPAAWEGIETARDLEGRFQLEASPVDRAARRLWGVPVVVSNAVPAGTGVLLDLDAVSLHTDTTGAQLRWDESSGFDVNTARARLELRAAVAVTQPAGVVSIDLTA